jgi:hypothetical protein
MVWHGKFWEVITLNKDANYNNPNKYPICIDVFKPTEHELTVFRLMRKLEYGEIRIVIKNSHVVQNEKKKSIKL